MWTGQFGGYGRAPGAVGRFVEMDKVDRLEGYLGHEIIASTNDDQ